MFCHVTTCEIRRLPQTRGVYNLISTKLGIFPPRASKKLILFPYEACREQEKYAVRDDRVLSCDSRTLIGSVLETPSDKSSSLRLPISDLEDHCGAG